MAAGIPRIDPAGFYRLFAHWRSARPGWSKWAGAERKRRSITRWRYIRPLALAGWGLAKPHALPKEKMRKRLEDFSRAQTLDPREREPAITLASRCQNLNRSADAIQSFRGGDQD